MNSSGGNNGVVEGWYGQPYPKPLARTRVRRILRVRRDPLHRTALPYALRGRSTGLGKALKATVHPLRADIPIMLGAEGPKNVALAAEIADGWLPFWFSPKSDTFYRDALAAGFARPGSRHQSLDTFEVVSLLPVLVDDDVEGCAASSGPMIALYIGGMGAKGANFHYDVFARLGYEAECEQIQQLYLAGRKPEAIAAVPPAMVEDVALVGPRTRSPTNSSSGRALVLTTLLVSGPPELPRSGRRARRLIARPRSLAAALSFSRRHTCPATLAAARQPVPRLRIRLSERCGATAQREVTGDRQLLAALPNHLRHLVKEGGEHLVDVGLAH